MPRVDRLTDHDVGGWTLTCNPRTTDLDAVRAGGGAVRRWCVRPSYRLGLVRVGHPVYLWVTTARGAAASGVWARGVVTALPRDGTVALDMTVRDLLVPRAAVVAAPGLGDLEVLRAPFMSNPQVVRPEEARLLDALLDSLLDG